MNEPSCEQKRAIAQRGRFVLLACPGSGKTFTVAHRLAKQLREWKESHAGIATLSFTNVAREEISAHLQILGCPAMPPYPHFLGTIDSFINTWIFLPFGHLVMKCQGRPNIVGMDDSPWMPSGKGWVWGKRECNSNGCRLIRFTYDINGNLINLDRERGNCPQGRKPCERLKERFVRQGYATQADANYWAMRILEMYPQIARALARHFPEMIIDEAQDTSDTQMQIVDLLVENGLSEVMLVGDPDQAIYEWRDAKPEVFVSKTNAMGWKRHLRLSDNRRSSQHICNATVGFSKYLAKPSKAVGNDADFEVRPKIIEYDPQVLSALQDEFIVRCQRCGVVPKSDRTAILVRTRRMLRKILGQQKTEVSPWNHEITRLLAYAAYHYYEQRDPKQAMRYVQNAIARLCFGESHSNKLEMEQQIAATMGNRHWRASNWQLLKRLPSSDVALSNWVVEAEIELNRWFGATGWSVVAQDDLALAVKEWTRVDGKRDKSFHNWPISDFFVVPSYRQDQLTVETIHAAKGKTYEAVFFVVSDNKSRKGTAKQLGELPDGDEEIRTAYVAMTRPRKLLIVAVPEGTDRKYLHRFPEWMKTELPGQLALF